MELSVVRYIREHGFAKTVEDFKLKFRDYPHKLLLRYDMIESPMSEEEVRDSRGLVLEKDSWRVMSLAFRKFFNYGEGRAAEIDWPSARAYKKLDGSLIHVYYDSHYGFDDERRICVGTTGTAEGEGRADNFHYTADFVDPTFRNLFVYALNETVDRTLGKAPAPGSVVFPDGTTMRKEGERNLFWHFEWWRHYTMAFELCTPYNVVVTPHTESTVYLIGMRSMRTLEELPYVKLARIAAAMGVPLAPCIEFASLTPENLLSSFAGMPFSDEGYIVVDKHFNRVKVKNPAYCAVHMMKGSTASWRIIEVVRSGETDEFKATFPGRLAEIEELSVAYDKLVLTLGAVLSDMQALPTYREHRAIQDKEAMIKTQKTLALWIQKTCGERDLGRFTALLYSNMRKDLGVREYLTGYDGEDLYDILGKK